MKYLFLVLGTALVLGSASPAAAAKAPFGCEARAPNVCYFRIFYTRGDRIVVLPARMKVQVPDVAIGQDRYCVTLGKAPAYTCTKKIINATYNQ